MMRASDKCSSMISVVVDICHRMALLQMLYSMTLTFIFKVKYFIFIVFFLLCICYKKMCRQRMSPADLPRLAWPLPWICFVLLVFCAEIYCKIVIMKPSYALSDDTGHMPRELWQIQSSSRKDGSEVMELLSWLETTCCIYWCIY